MSSGERNNRAKPNSFLPAAVLTGCVIIVLWLFATPLCKFCGVIDACENGSDAINALFTGLALAGVVATLWFQAHQAKEQDVAQQEQKEMTTLSAYLNALTALQTALPPSDLHPHQAHAHRKILAIVDALHPKMLAFVGQLAGVPSVDIDIADRLRKSISEIDREVNPSDSARAEENYEKLIEILSPQREMYLRLEKSMIGISSKKLEGVRDCIKQLNWLEGRQHRATAKTAVGQTEQFKTYRCEVQKYINLIKELASLLESKTKE